MAPKHILDGIEALRRDFETEIVEDERSLIEVFRLRYLVYSIERQFEAGQDGLETDSFDPVSRHILLRHRPTGQAIGTVRLVIPTFNGFDAKLPMEMAVDTPRLCTIPRSQLAEVSRFALSKGLRAASGLLDCLGRLALIRGLVQLSGCIGVTHWCALMEPKLLRLLGASGIHSFPLAGLVEHHGLRQPSFVAINEMLERMRQEQPAIWDFVTETGASWPNGLAAAA